jgi:hypothetical protein
MQRAEPPIKYAIDKDEAVLEQRRYSRMIDQRMNATTLHDDDRDGTRVYNAA